MSRVQRVIGSISAKPWFRPFAVKVAPAIDRGLSRLTHGRFVLSQLFVPTLVLTHTGAKSGQTRVSPLALPAGVRKTRSWWSAATRAHRRIPPGATTCSPTHRSG